VLKAFLIQSVSMLDYYINDVYDLTVGVSRQVIVALLYLFVGSLSKRFFDEFNSKLFEKCDSHFVAFFFLLIFWNFF
jgi:hypothetical protein